MSDDMRPWSRALAAPRVAWLPPPAETDDSNRWTTGRCWLWCGRERTRVLWIGTGTVLGGVTAHLFACASCAEALGDQVLDSQLSACIGGGDISGYASIGASAQFRATARPSGRHRRRP
jgi:hypothetical protein